jgi:hypothetical protein
MTAAITWAVLATVGAVAVYWLMRREVRKIDRMGYGQFVRAEKLAGKLADEKLVQRPYVGVGCRVVRAAIDAEDRLRKIEQARHLSAKHARAAQLAAKRLQVVGKAAEINREMGR